MKLSNSLGRSIFICLTNFCAGGSGGECGFWMWGAGQGATWCIFSGKGTRCLESTRRLAASLAPGLPADNFRVEAVEEMSFPGGFADVVLSSAVLHFARGDEQFLAMLHGTWRVLKAGGMLFCRLASSIGMEQQVRRIGGRRFLLPDGSERYLVDAELLGQLTGELGGRLMDPLKTTVVQNQRCMTTWVVRKNG
jgi:tellurite methyltransferase